MNETQAPAEPDIPTTDATTPVTIPATPDAAPSQDGNGAKPKRETRGARNARAAGAAMARAAKPRKAPAAHKDGKVQPTGKVAAYIDALRTTPEKRFAIKEWRRLDGQRATRATPFGLTSGRVATIRTEVAAVMGVTVAAKPATARKATATKPKGKTRRTRATKGKASARKK